MDIAAMNEPTFQIVFRGKILGGFDRDQVRANPLAALGIAFAAGYVVAKVFGR